MTTDEMLTRKVQLWIFNDEGILEYWVNRYAEVLSAADNPGYTLARELQTAFEEEAYDAIPNAGPLADLLYAAVACVDWSELSDQIIDYVDNS